MRRKSLRLLAVLGLLLVASVPPAHAVEPGEVLADPALEARARALSTGLRCLVCQNQSIDDSSAPLARDLRLLVRERLAAGDSDKAVLDYIVARYGEFVLLRPRFGVGTLLLWLAPLLLLGGGVALAMRQLAIGRPSPAGTGEPPPLSADESRQVEELLKRRS